MRMTKIEAKKIIKECVNENVDISGLLCCHGDIQTVELILNYIIPMCEYIFEKRGIE